MADPPEMEPPLFTVLFDQDKPSNDPNVVHARNALHISLGRYQLMALPPGPPDDRDNAPPWTVVRLRYYPRSTRSMGSFRSSMQVPYAPMTCHATEKEAIAALWAEVACLLLQEPSLDVIYDKAVA